MLNIQSPTGKKTIKVSKWTYEHVYKSKGYVIVSDDLKHDKADKVSRNESEARKINNESVENVPLSEMNKEQLLRFAKEHNIDVSMAKSSNEARKIIRNAINKDRM